MSGRERLHDYAATVSWTGAASGSTKTYSGYSREHEVDFEGKATLRGSADGSFRGDPALVNPEEMLVASLSACHMLSFLAVCALQGIEIVSYVDRARGQMSETSGSGRFVSVTLAPHVVVAHEADLVRAAAAHGAAHDACFIANSVNFPVTHEAVTSVATVSVP